MVTLLGKRRVNSPVNAPAGWPVHTGAERWQYRLWWCRIGCGGKRWLVSSPRYERWVAPFSTHCLLTVNCRLSAGEVQRW
jgi:hypothetical protein